MNGALLEVNTLSILRDLALEASYRSYSPYTSRCVGVVVLLEDGSVVKGTRVENASFSLTISALLNAVSTLHVIGRMDICAIVSSEPFSKFDLTYVSTMPNFEFDLVAQDVLVSIPELPEPKEVLLPLIEDWGEDPADGARTAHSTAELAHVPESNFPVGCVIRTEDGHHIPGVNVEHPDWSQILCAERNALSAAVAYGYGPATEIFVSCLNEPEGSPCGACRQVILELAPNATVWMDRGKLAPARTQAGDLLPGHFTGDTLRKRAR